ncbi:hypothetical protein [Xanthomarina gelatinilytica]|uniref:hypothetical protein n=1 Tax=Xanthomarina gelatinilytica TaxID=1137281 RepID=UPI003AA996A2
MPVNELEIHPYLEDINYQDFKVNHFENLIIGTFPVYSITDTLTPEEEIEEHVLNENDAYMSFFYGSKKNSFWRLVTHGLGEQVNPIDLPLEDRKVAAINLLTNQKFLITDAVYKTNRKDEKAEDKYLWADTNNEYVLKNRTLNFGIEEILKNNKNIKYLYFTSTALTGKSPFGWFQQIFQNQLQYNIIQHVDNRPISAEVRIGNRTYIAFFLPSPAGNGTRGLHFTNTSRTEIFINYIQSVDIVFYNEINNIPQANRTAAQKQRLTALRRGYLHQHYREVLQNKNQHFNGSI